MPSYVNPPVLVVGFNRPELMREQLIRLRDIRPSRLYVACDGPRPGREADIQTTTAVKESIELVDWPCEVQTLFQDQNLGCGKGVSTAITWFLQHEPGGIILEDDVVATPDFHNFAGEMLQRYADDPRVWSVMGLSLDRPDVRARQTNSYRFTTMPQVWGWATWATTWESFTLDISDWPAWLDLDVMAPDERGAAPTQRYCRRQGRRLGTEPRCAQLASRWPARDAAARPHHECGRFRRCHPPGLRANPDARAGVSRLAAHRTLRCHHRPRR